MARVKVHLLPILQLIGSQLSVEGVWQAPGQGEGGGGGGDHSELPRGTRSCREGWRERGQQERGRGEGGECVHMSGRGREDQEDKVN